MALVERVSSSSNSFCCWSELGTVSAVTIFHTSVVHCFKMIAVSLSGLLPNTARILQKVAKQNLKLLK